MPENDNPQKDYYPMEIPNPDPTRYSIFKQGPKGGLTFYPRNIIKYLEAKWVVYDGHTPRIFNGRSYQVIPDNKFVAMVADSVDAYMTDTLVSKGQYQSIFFNAEAILDFDRVPYFEDPEQRDDYSVVEEQRIAGGLFAFENGILNTANGKFLPFTHLLMVRSCYNCRYDPSVQTCRAESIIEGILPDADTRRFFFEMVGSILFGDMNPPAIFVIYGPGETGKSALANMLTTLMGNEMVSRETLKQLGTDKYSPAELEGKRLNVSGETGAAKNKYTTPDGELIKQLSDGQEISVQRKYGHPYKIRNTAKLLFLTNTVPDFGDTSSGLYRRLYTIPCRAKQDPKAKLYEQMTDPQSLSWLANRALEGYLRVKSRGFKFEPSEEMQKEWQNMRVQDPVFDFLYTTFDSTDLHDVCSQIVSHSEYRRTKYIYDKYREFCYANNVTPLGSRKFYEKLRNETEMDISNNPQKFHIDGHTSSSLVFVWKESVLKAHLQSKTGKDKEKP